MAIVKNHQISNQVVVFDDFQLIITNIFSNVVRSKINPLCELIEAFAFILCGLNDAAQISIADIFQQKKRANDTP